MELKVWVEGIQRIVCGVTDNTSCQDVVYALAAATGKTGRFTLIERWRNNERLLSPNENPLKLLTKYGEYSNDVQFILQRSASSGLRQKTPDSLNGFTPTTSPPAVSPPSTPDRNRDIRKSLTFSGGSRLEVRDDKALREAPPYREPPRPISPLPQSQRSLPPYRAPPPPGSSPNRATPPVDAVSPPGKTKPKRNLQKDFQHVESMQGAEPPPPEALLYNAQYRDLIRLVNYQREKLSSQQSDLSKFDTEIVYWESKAREHQQQMEFIGQEVTHVEAVSRLGEDQLRSLSNVEEESEIVRQQEKTLKSELTLLRSKLANCETELLQCKNKIRLMVDEVSLEQRSLVRESEDRQSMERSLLGEVDRLQREVEQARQSSEMASQCGDSLKREVSSLEMAISEKKKQVERLVSDMKEANLQSLAIAPPDELKHFLEGPHKPGSTRKMIGSPRQLENAVPTSKNPHGVWV